VALETQKPIFVAKSVWDKVSDMTPFLQELKKKFETGEGMEEDDGEGGAKGEKPRDGGKGPGKKS